MIHLISAQPRVGAILMAAGTAWAWRRHWFTQTTHISHGDGSLLPMKWWCQKRMKVRYVYDTHQSSVVTDFWEGKKKWNRDHKSIHFVDHIPTWSMALKLGQSLCGGPFHSRAFALRWKGQMPFPLCCERQGHHLTEKKKNCIVKCAISQVLFEVIMGSDVFLKTRLHLQPWCQHELAFEFVT